MCSDKGLFAGAEVDKLKDNVELFGWNGHVDVVEMIAFE